MLFGYYEIIRVLPCLADPEKIRVIAEAGDGRTVKNFETNRLKIVNPVRNSSRGINPYRNYSKSNPAELQRGIISNGVKGADLNE